MIGGGYGRCADAGEETLSCLWEPETDSCASASAGDACVATDVEGTEIDSMCTYDALDQLICPALDAERMESCEGSSTWDNCRVGGTNGYCVNSWEDVTVCITENEYYRGLKGTCGSSDEGDACTSSYPASPWAGECVEAYGEIYCQPFGENWSDEGGLDGINVDECENVYVTEYVTGKIWVMPADGSEPEVAVEMPAYWIPNIRWGKGVGGWEKDQLMVMNRENGRMYVIEMTRRGGETAYELDE